MDQPNLFILKGNIIFTKVKEEFTFLENGYIVVENGKVKGTYSTIPDAYKEVPITDYGDKLIIPGFVDLHIHAPQYPNSGLCLDVQLIDWLFNCTFPLEAKYDNLEFAKRVYSVLIKEIWNCGTTRSIVYNTIHKDSTKLLIDMFIQSGLGAFIGKVNMDINAPDYLREETLQSLIETEEILREYCGLSNLVKPIIAPRFVPACSPELMVGLAKLADVYHVPITSHLSEELEEIRIVKEMYPTFPTYASIYDYFGLFGQECTVMAHSVFSTDEEIALIKQNNVFIAHCPSSNTNLGSGMMPVRKFLNMDIHVGLGSDVGGGDNVSMFPVMQYALSISKLVWLYSGKLLEPLKPSEAFYLATKGGGAFFGKVGSFEPGYEFDALVIDDKNINTFNYDLYARVQRLIYLGDCSNVVERYVAGNKIPEPVFD